MNEILLLINSTAPYLLLGFMLAGLMHTFVPHCFYQQHLGKSSFKSILHATLIAIPLPLCSCGVIPAAMSLRREGVSKGSVVAFLIATPQTGVDSILATYSLMGLPFAIIRPIAALVTAIFGGQLTNVLEKKLNDNDSGTVRVAEENVDPSVTGRIKSAISYAFYEMMQDIGKWLALGLVIAGLITVYVPDTFFAQFSENTMLSIFIVLIFAIPMYLCATGSVLIAVALMMKGLSPGAALVLLMAGPAVNVASILVINKVMGWRTLAIYLFSIIAGSIFFALCIDYLFPREFFVGLLMGEGGIPYTDIPLFNWLCSGLLLLFLTNALIRRYFVSSRKKVCDCTVTLDGMQSAADPEKNRTVMIRIGGMKCNHCRANVEKAILSVPGVGHTDVDLQSGTAEITGDFAMLEVIASVEGSGFKVIE